MASDALEIDVGRVENKSEKKAPKKKWRIPFKTAIAAIGLLFIGMTLFGLAIDFYIDHPHHEGTIPILILSIIALCPGAYSTVNLFGAYRGWHGFSVDDIPSYEVL